MKEDRYKKEGEPKKPLSMYWHGFHHHIERVSKGNKKIKRRDKNKKSKRSRKGNR